MDVLSKACYETQKLIDKYFTLENPIEVDTDEKLEAILANPEKMLPLLKYLEVINEFEEEEIIPITEHFVFTKEISKFEQAKKQAAIDEDYEKAAHLKKQIAKLQDECLTVQKLRTNYIQKEPIMRTREVLREMNDIDPCYTKSFLETNMRSGKTHSLQKKAKFVNQLLILQGMTGTNKGLEKVKNGFEMTLQVIHQQVRVTEEAQKAMNSDLDELTSEELSQFKTHKKVQVFLTGIQALLVALTLQVCTLETAEQLDSQFQMDFEAILNEARQLKQRLLGLKEQIDRLLEIENSVLLCDNIDYGSDIDWSMSEGTIDKKKKLDTLMTVAKQKQTSASVICQLCCQRLTLGR